MFGQEEQEPLAYLLDQEPVVVFGYSLSEFMVSAAVFIIGGAVIFGFLFLLIGLFVPGVVLGVLVGGAAVIIIGKNLQKKKETKPNGYYGLKLKVNINRFIPLGFIHRNAKWFTQRSR